jgi:1-acyl-sn-glycerol-3-phosphate acyltransferase
VIGSCSAAFLSLFFKKKPFPIIGRLWCQFVLSLAGVKVEVNGLENIPKNEPVIFASNHQGAADIPAAVVSLPGFRFVFKKELLKVPFFGWFLKQAGYFPVDRATSLTYYKSLKDIGKTIKVGESILIYPEGTRSPNGKLGQFKHASLLPALNSGAPVVPVAVSGSINALRRGSLLIHPARVKLSIGKPIYIRSEKEYEDKLKELREAIAKML